MKRQKQSVTALKKYIPAALAAVFMASVTACAPVAITGGSLDSHAEATVEKDTPAASIGVTPKLEFVKDAPAPHSEADGPKAGESILDMAPLFDLIGEAEGTDRGDGYDETLAYGAFTGGNVSLTRMTLAEIDKLQTAMLQHPGNRWNSSALGRYQITRTTLRGLKRKLALPETALFTPALQDKLAYELLKNRGLLGWKAGEISNYQFAANLAMEWASLPHPATGAGHYPGQAAAVDSAILGAILRRLR